MRLYQFDRLTKILDPYTYCMEIIQSYVTSTFSQVLEVDHSQQYIFLDGKYYQSNNPENWDKIYTIIVENQLSEQTGYKHYTSLSQKLLKEKIHETITRFIEQFKLSFEEEEIKIIEKQLIQTLTAQFPPYLLRNTTEPQAVPISTLTIALAKKIIETMFHLKIPNHAIIWEETLAFAEEYASHRDSKRYIEQITALLTKCYGKGEIPPVLSDYFLFYYLYYIAYQITESGLTEIESKTYPTLNKVDFEAHLISREKMFLEETSSVKMGGFLFETLERLQVLKRKTSNMSGQQGRESLVSLDAIGDAELSLSATYNKPYLVISETKEASFKEVYIKNMRVKLQNTAADLNITHTQKYKTRPKSLLKHLIRPNSVTNTIDRNSLQEFLEYFNDIQGLLPILDKNPETLTRTERLDVQKLYKCILFLYDIDMLAFQKETTLAFDHINRLCRLALNFTLSRTEILDISQSILENTSLVIARVDSDKVKSKEKLSGYRQMFNRVIGLKHYVLLASNDLCIYSHFNYFYLSSVIAYTGRKFTPMYPITLKSNKFMLSFLTFRNRAPITVTEKNFKQILQTCLRELPHLTDSEKQKWEKETYEQFQNKTLEATNDYILAYFKSTPKLDVTQSWKNEMSFQNFISKYYDGLKKPQKAFYVYAIGQRRRRNDPYISGFIQKDATSSVFQC